MEYPRTCNIISTRVFLYKGVFYLNFKRYFNMKLHNNSLYYISDEKGKRELFRYDIKQKWSKQLTKTDENVKGYWFVGDKLYVSIDFSGNEREQLYLLKNGSLEPVIDEPEYFHHFLTELNNTVYFTKNHHLDAGFRIFNLENEVLGQFDAPTKIIGTINDNYLVLKMDYSSVESELVLLDVNSNEVVDIPVEGHRFSSFKQITQTKALIITDATNGFMNLHMMNLQTYELEALTDLDADILSYKHFKNKEYIVDVNEAGYSALYSFSLHDYVLDPLDFYQDGVVHGYEVDNQKLYVLFSSMNSPMQVYHYTFDNGSIKQLFGNKPIDAFKTTKKSYMTFDEREIEYFMYPIDEDNIPTVIHIHGGPESQARPEFNELYYDLYRDGFQVAIPNIRGSSGYGVDFLKLDDIEKRLDAMQDIIELKKHLVEGNADKDNIFVMGRSYGGFMTLLLATHHSEEFKGAVDIVGISHLKTFLNNTPSWRRNLRSKEYGFIGTHDEFMERIAPLNNSENVTIPLRIFHSKHDARVPNSESVQMYEKMKGNGQDVEFTSYPNDGHAYMFNKNTDDMHVKIRTFFKSLI